ncbi:ABC transporter ATP-binding protein [Ruminiclostridium cellobioparum]|uniref:ABC transporter, ATP-binding protein n=1 Tax=Ruminiclostridium cellobioparum subsp. termitidis CT1112 TaxID=1195236 RepID=S0FF64_RUMCE|nr:ABC transporter ATP-binding protein [Ruminiclostridium cellobioparum]EMS69335.1 ABC transporter, ATP-binding protein [Ruminiclostridium cellobioparum subsp. termitidis CT1112]
MFRLVKYLKPYIKQVTLGPAFKLLEAILELLIPLLMAKLIDNGVKANNSSYIYMMGGLMLLTAVIGAGSAFICQYYASIASQGFGTTMRNLLFKKIQSFSFNEIDKIGTPSLINRITSDVNQLQFAVAMLIRLVIRVPFLCIGGVVMAMIINVKLSLVLLIVMPLFAAFLYIVMSRSIPMYKSVQKKLDTLSTVIRENLSGARVVRAFARLDKERERFIKSNKEYADNSVRVGRISALLNPATTVIINLGVAAILWFGGYQVYEGSMSQGEIIAYINYVNMILSALIVLANLVITFTKAAASAARVNELLDLEPSISDPTEEQLKSIDQLTDLSGESNSTEKAEEPVIEFKNVSFSYDGSAENVLQDISFRIYKGQVTGIIGSTGAGKTTLISLIARFYDTTGGAVCINGTDVKKLKQNELRNKIGMVPQKSVLFSGTMEENLKWGKHDAAPDDMVKAAKVAQAYEFIEKKPEGFSTQIVQGGRNLSGGQKQRLAIARALIKKPEILILDDSSSALDYATDASLRRELKENLTDTTVIIVTQRVAAIRNAELIVVMDEGEIVGMGRNEELLESCAVYREIVNSQDESGVAPDEK